MINAVRGRIISLGADSLDILTQYGIELHLEASKRTISILSNIPIEERGEVRVLTVLQHREDAMTLFGFADENERTLFNELLTVSGIGKQGAFKILSGISIENFALALDRQDVKALSAVPGIGPKLASKLILELRGKLVLDTESEGLGDGRDSLFSENYGELINSLIDAGYDRRIVRKELDGILKEEKDKLSELGAKKREERILKILIKRLS